MKYDEYTIQNVEYDVANYIPNGPTEFRAIWEKFLLENLSTTRNENIFYCFSVKFLTAHIHTKKMREKYDKTKCVPFQIIKTIKFNTNFIVVRFVPFHSHNEENVYVS